MSMLAFSAEGYAVILDGAADIPSDAIAITAADEAIIRAAISRGAAVTRNGSSWIITERVIPIEAQRALWSMTDIQFAIAASSAPFNFMSDQEAQDWAGAGVIPAFGLAALASISDPATRREATIRFRGARTFWRLDPFMALLQGLKGLTDEQVDAFFLFGMSK